MKKISYIIIAIAIAITVTTLSCTEDFDVTLGSTYERVIIQGSISNERKAHQVILSKSADYFSNQQTPRITGATVTISDGDTTFYLTEISDGIYETDTLAGEPGKTYTLDIIIDDQSYTSSCYLNYCSPIDSIKIGYYDYGDIDEYDNFVVVLLYAQEPATPNNYYLWNVYRNDTLISDTLSAKRLETDMFVNGLYISDYEAQWLEVQIGDTVMLEMQSIVEEYYDYFFQVMAETVWDGGPFEGPPANPKGNISNDALGFFLAYSVERSTTIVPEKDEWIELTWY